MKAMHRLMEVSIARVNTKPARVVHFTFFQMVYVMGGSGMLRINGNRIPYRKGNLMLLTPEDRYRFEAKEESVFLQVCFNKGYIDEYRWKSIDHLDCLLYYASHVSGCILKNGADSVLVETIAEGLLHSIEHGGLYNEDLITHFVNSLIVISARNLSSVRPPALKINTDKRMLDILDYIQSNICFPGKLKAPVVASHFGISGAYLGSYFKSQCGETMQHYISLYKIGLIEHRLKFSDRRINEIAVEFGFSDESHLNKFFRKHRGVNLTEFRKNGEATLGIIIDRQKN